MEVHYCLNKFLDEQDILIESENFNEIDHDKYILSGGEIKILDNDKIKNPFFIEMNNKNEKELFSRLYKIYDSLLILCLKDNANNISEIKEYFFNEIYTNDQINNISENFTLYRCNMNILKQSNFKKIYCILNNDFLKKYFSNTSLDFEVSELVIPLIELKEKNAKIYTSLYDDFNNFEKLDVILDTSKLYNKSYCDPIKKNSINFLLNFNISFWSNIINCNFNMTKDFMNRNFTYNILKQSNIEEGIKNNISNEKKKNVINNLKNESEDIDYIKSIFDDNKSFVDIYNSLNETNRTYYAKTDDNSLKLTKGNIEEYLLNKTNFDYDKFFLINNLIVSKEYCHLVINNFELLKKLNEEKYFDKNKIIFKYTFGYGWLCMYIEECIFKTKSTKDSRHVFTIDTINQLPYFPISFDDIWQNPYMTLLLEKNSINLENNCTSLLPINDEKYYGTCSLIEFKERLNIFISGNSTENIFNGLDWSKFALSGSIILACSERRSPLMDYYLKNCKQNQLSEYYNVFFKDSDIDLMSNTESILQFIKNASHFHDVLKKNLDSINNEKSMIEIIPVKYSGIIITDYFIEHYLNELNQELGLELSKSEFINKIENKSYDLNDYFYDIYFEVKKNMVKNFKNNNGDVYNDPHINNEILRMFLKKNDSEKINICYKSLKIKKIDYENNDLEHCVFINDISKENVDDDNNFLVYKLTEGIRYKFKSELLQRDIELFQVKGSDYFSVVGKFHFPCVRSYYNGENVYYLPSAVTSYMTKINIDYKYFAGTNDPIKIANKYRSRGFSAIFNKNEINHMCYYNNEIKEGNEIYHIDSKNKDDIINDLKSKKIVDKIFNDINTKNNIFENKYDGEDFFNYLNDINDIKLLYKEKYNYNSDKSAIDMFKIKTINEEGNINPFEDWVLKAYWNIFLNK